MATVDDVLLAIQKLDTSNSAKLDTLIDSGVKVDETAVLAAITGVQATANLILAQDMPTPPNPPVLTAIDPANGSIAGGETVTVTGTNLLGTTGVLVGTVAATNVKVTSDTSLTFTSSPQGAGVEAITLVGPGGTSAVVPAGAYTLA